MNAEFDPAEFETDAPPLDYRDLLGAMSAAGAEGVRQEIAPLLAAIKQDAASREAWRRDTKEGLSEFGRAARDMNRAANDLHHAHVKEAVIGGAIVLGVIILALAAFQYFREPKVVQKLYGCSAAWDAKTQTCKGRWVPLEANGGS